MASDNDDIEAPTIASGKRSNVMTSNALMGTMRGESLKKQKTLETQNYTLLLRTATLERELKEQIAMNNAGMATLQRELKEQKAMNNAGMVKNKKLKKLEDIANTGTDGEAVAGVLRYRYPAQWASTWAADAADSILVTGLEQLALADALRQKIDKDTRDKNPLKDAAEVAKVMDLTGAILNHSGLDVLRNIVKEGTGIDGEPGATEIGGKWLTSKRQVTGVMKRVELAAEDVCPFEVSFEEGIDAAA
jgi:hypothetical protein